MLSSVTAENSSPALLTGPAYRIATSRLVIRCWNPSDAGLLKVAIDANLDHLKAWMPWATKEPQPLEGRVAWIRKCRGEFDLGKDFIYDVFNPEENEVIGGTGLHTRQGAEVREIGYWIQEKHARKGFATEVTAALTKVAFVVDKVKRVEIYCATGNANSAGIPRKLGFVHEAVLRKRINNANGEALNLMVWTMLAEEYPASIPSKEDLTAYDVIGRRLI